MLRRLERAIWQMEEQVIQEHAPELALTTYTHPPQVLQQALLIRLARHLRHTIAALSAEYGIESEEEDMQRMWDATLTLLWAELEDTRPHTLRQYGSLHPDTAKQLEPRIQHLIDLVLALDGVIRGTTSYENVQALVEQEHIS